MELTYKTKKLRNLCENSKFNKELVKGYGVDVAKKLPQRIKELKAFESLNDVPVFPPFRRHKLKGDKSELYAVNINMQYRLIFKVLNKIVDDLKNIDKIMIMEVSKHYE